jgi:hypothetical protein
MTEEELKAEVERLKAENEALKSPAAAIVAQGERERRSHPCTG